VARRGGKKGGYSDVNYAVLQVVLIVLMMFLILGAIAFPYYISPITASGASQALPYAILNLFLIVLFLAAAYLLDEKNTELGSVFLILGLVLAVIMVWAYYGVAALRQVLISV
jgi:hypothetical protein